MILSCDCGAKLKIDDAKVAAGGVKVRCPRCGTVHRVQPPAMPQAEPAMPWFAHNAPGPEQPLVIVAHDSKVVADMIRNVLAGGGFSIEYASNGNDAVAKARELKPRAMIVDVGLTGIYGFEVCERLKNDPETRNIRLILLSSVYDMTRYKRAPVNLYGADDYIEKHHIPDKLVGKVQRLLSGAPESAPSAGDGPKGPLSSRKPAPREFDVAQLSPAEFFQGEPARKEAPAAAVQTAMQPAPEERPPVPEAPAITPEKIRLDASIFQQDEYDVPNRDANFDPDAVEKARRFARIIVSDIALYNQDTVVEGLKSGSFYELLRDDIQEGRELYEKRVPAAVKTIKDYYQEAFDNFIASKKNVR